MGAGFSMIVFIAAWLSLSVVVDAQSWERDAWGNWGYDGPRGQPWKHCPGCGSPWGPYGGYGLDPTDPRFERNREHGMEPEQEGRGYGSDQGPEYDYGPYHPGFEYPPYDFHRRRPPKDSKPRDMEE